MKNWLWAFALAAAANLLGQLLRHDPLVLFSKPLLMPLLAVWFWRTTANKGGWLPKAVLAALFFSTLGDVLLMFEGGNFFLMGLGAFLVAHLFYMSGFFANASLSAGFLRGRALWLLPFLAYLTGLLAMLWPGIPAAMQVPVAVYACVITGMALSVLNLKNSAEPGGWKWAMAGAVLFVLSDSLIAVEKFGQPFGGSRVTVMLTYIVGQYLLVRGAARMGSRPAAI